MEERFAGRLKELRTASGLSQTELASKVGLTVRQISRLETGVQHATWPTVLALCEALGVECNTFTDEPADKPAPERGRPRKADGQGEPAQSAKKTRKRKP